ncbi:TniQ family protein [Aureimonas sp. SK2]|uniref:TniQ family protein n=1 Tax=Aureimonas sp. SK2 TaxID=3015992 RepID=UPI0024446A61|nr:TniQ family protein [Aureimonas sp. SK2]
MLLHRSFVPHLHEDETLTSAVSRTSARLGRTARDFCADYGGVFQGIVEGRPDELRLFERTIGRPFPGVIVEGGGRTFAMANQQFPRHLLSRGRLRVCPCCIEDDMKSGSGPMEARPYGRAIWLIDAIRTCHVHGMALVVIDKDPAPSRLHDFAQLVAPFAEGLSHGTFATKGRQPSPLESHLINLFQGRTGGTGWLATYPPYAVVSQCEIFGAVVAHGSSATPASLTGDELYAAGQLGFEILDAGPSSIEAALKSLVAAHGAKKGELGGRLVFGRLYEWLAHETDDAVYEPLRVIMRNVAVNALPLGPGETFLGKAVEERKVHSIHTLHRSTGEHPKRLRKLLVAAEVVGPETSGLSDDRVVFPAAVADSLSGKVLGAMTLAGAARYLGVPRPNDRALLTSGVIDPLVSTSHRGPLKNVYSVADLDRLVERLHADASPIDASETHLVPILSAAKKANCSVMEVVQLLLDRRLRAVRIKPNLKPFPSIAVDPKEVGTLVRGPEHGGMSLREVMRRMGTNDSVVKALVDAGHLPSKRAINPTNRCPQTVVLEPDLFEFSARYVSLMNLAKELGVHFRRLSAEITRGGAVPAFDPETVGATFYERSVVEPLIDKAPTDH